MSREIVHPVGKMYNLGIGDEFAHLLNSPVNITYMRLKTFYHLALKGYNKPEHTVGRRMLWTHVYNKLLLLVSSNDFYLLFHNLLANNINIIDIVLPKRKSP